MRIVLSERADLQKKLVVEKSQSGGYHVLYRCAEPVAGNLKLAERGIKVPGPGEHSHQGKTYRSQKYGQDHYVVMDMIETRGEGGYFLCAPSPGYELKRGDISQLPVISKEDRDYLIETARALNEWVVPKFEKNSGKTPWTEYNETTDPLPLLTSKGWTELRLTGHTPAGGRTILLRRPGKTQGHSGSVIDSKTFYCFSANAAPFEPQKAYSAFQVYALLNHGGDFKKAGRALSRDGFGDKCEPQKKRETPGRETALPAEQSDPDELKAQIEALNHRHAVIMLGGKCVILNEVIDPVFSRPDITFSSAADFKVRYANKKVFRENENGEVKAHCVANLWLQDSRRREYQGIVFSPGKDVPGCYNLYRGFAVTPRRGDWQLNRNHIYEVICGGSDLHYAYLIDWMADIAQRAQNPRGEKPGVAVVMKGGRGAGKGTFAQAIGGIFGSHFLHVTSPNQFIGRFNQHLKDCLVLFADEAFWAGDKTGEGILKALITEPTIRVEPKGKDSFSVKNHVSIIMASNNDWVIPAGLDERRFFVLEVSNDRRQDHEYFKALHDEMNNGGREAMLYDLLNVDLSNANLRDVPQTTGLFEQKLLSSDSVTKFWFSRLQNGAQLREDRSWASFTETQKLYDEYVRYAQNLKVTRVEDDDSLAARYGGSALESGDREGSQFWGNG